MEELDTVLGRGQVNFKLLVWREGAKRAFWTSDSRLLPGKHFLALKPSMHFTSSVLMLRTKQQIISLNPSSHP